MDALGVSAIDVEVVVDAGSVIAADDDLEIVPAERAVRGGEVVQFEVGSRPGEALVCATSGSTVETVWPMIRAM
jgi:hypothetical protein